MGLESPETISKIIFVSYLVSKMDWDPVKFQRFSPRQFSPSQFSLSETIQSWENSVLENSVLKKSVQDSSVLRQFSPEKFNLRQFGPKSILSKKIQSQCNSVQSEISNRGPLVIYVAEMGLFIKITILTILSVIKTLSELNRCYILRNVLF